MLETCATKRSSGYDFRKILNLQIFSPNITCFHGPFKSHKNHKHIAVVELLLYIVRLELEQLLLEKRKDFLVCQRRTKSKMQKKLHFLPPKKVQNKWVLSDFSAQNFYERVWWTPKLAVLLSQLWATLWAVLVQLSYIPNQALLLQSEGFYKEMFLDFRL